MRLGGDSVVSVGVRMFDGEKGDILLYLGWTGLGSVYGVSKAAQSGVLSEPTLYGERKMNRRTAIRRLATFFLTGASLAQAQQPKKVPRIGYLASRDPASESARAEAIRLALRGRGHIEGQNIATEYRYAEGKRGRESELATELVHLKVDIIVVAGGGRLIRAAMNATKTIPIVMVGDGADPVEIGLVDSLARPGGNVTGITNLGGELGGKRLELLKEAVTKLARVAVLYDPAVPPSVRDVKEVLPVAARALKLTLQPREVRSANDLDKVFAALNKHRPDGLYVLGGPLMRANEKRIIDFALKSRLPSTYVFRETVEAGGLMYYGADEAESYRPVAYFVDRILKGTKPADLPVERPMRFELVVNLKTAKQIGVTIDPNLLARANKLIK